MMKKKIIKVTEQQLKETEGKAFEYLDIEDDTTPNNGNSEISVSGKLNDTENGKPITGDKISNTITPQTYNRFHHYANQFHNTLRENSDKNNDGVDDFYNNEEMNILNDNDNDNDIVRIPQSVLSKIDLLIEAINNSNLTPKQECIILNKLIMNMKINEAPFSWIKELIIKLRNNNKTK